MDYLERAFDASKYGEFSQHPYLEATIPTLHDPSLAPAGKHVMSIYMQYAPYKLRNADWDTQRDALGDVVVNTLAQYAPDLPGKIEAREVITPKDLEQTYGLTGGHIFHGELALDQLFTMRPLLDWAQYRTPIKSLYLCGSGTHPGNGLTGGSGANAAREIVKGLAKADEAGVVTRLALPKLADAVLLIACGEVGHRCAEDRRLASGNTAMLLQEPTTSEIPIKSYF